MRERVSERESVSEVESYNDILKSSVYRGFMQEICYTKALSFGGEIKFARWTTRMWFGSWMILCTVTTAA